jgi:hypothetical protein
MLTESEEQSAGGELLKAMFELRNSEEISNIMQAIPEEYHEQLGKLIASSFHAGITFWNAVWRDITGKIDRGELR